MDFDITLVFWRQSFPLKAVGFSYWKPNLWGAIRLMLVTGCCATITDCRKKTLKLSSHLCKICYVSHPFVALRFIYAFKTMQMRGEQEDKSRKYFLSLDHLAFKITASTWYSKGSLNHDIVCVPRIKEIYSYFCYTSYVIKYTF